jgi:hypothetical protein
MTRRTPTRRLGLETLEGRAVPAVLHLTAVAAGEGGQSHVCVYNPDGTDRFSFLAYPGFNGPVSVATGDVNGDGVDDVITGIAAGAGPHVKVFDGVTGQLIRSFYAYDPSFTGGVNVAAGDVNGDGHADIITGVASGAGPHVKVFDGATGQVLHSFYAYDPSFTGGVTVAAGDVNGDGRADVVTGTASATSHVKVFDGASGQLLHSFLAYPGFTGGVNVAAGDVNGDGRADVITGAGVGGNGHVKAFDGASGQLIDSFLAYNSGFAAGVAVSAVDDGSGQDAILTAPGGGDQVPRVQVIDAKTVLVDRVFYPFDLSFSGGVDTGHAGGQQPPPPPPVFPDLSHVLPDLNFGGITL